MHNNGMQSYQNARDAFMLNRYLGVMVFNEDEKDHIYYSEKKLITTNEVLI